MMKTTIIVFLCLYFASLQAEASIAFEFSPEEKACIEELNLNKDTIKKLYISVPIVEDNTDLNNFVHCAWRKEGYQNEDGTINYEKFKDSNYIMLRAFDDLIGDVDMKTLITSAVNTCQNNPPLKEKVHGYATKVMNCLVNNYRREKFGHV